ncbi:MAG: S-4TM family putative pore-forming effector [Acidobacteriota bacterium]|nr:S-4TM family putative pore-forming effector [Acidobacteriota bacterium]
MNQITTVQNTPKQLERLAAQRELYSSAKRLFTLQIIGNAFIPLTLSLVSTFHRSLSVYVAIYGICFFIIDSILIEPAIKKRKTKGAKIQEMFDSDVLQLNKSPFKTVEDVTVEEVLTHYNAHRKIESNIEKIKNWYNANLDALDISVARLICQRINYSWECGLRSAYSNLLKIINVLLPLVVFLTSLFANLSIEQTALIGGGLLPLFRFLTKQYQENKEASEKLTKLNNYFNKLWERLLKEEVDKKEMEKAARRIQDEIYDNRIKSPLIPDSFYRLYRPKEETLMTKTANTLAAELIESRT